MIAAGDATAVEDRDHHRRRSCFPELRRACAPADCATSAGALLGAAATWGRGYASSLGSGFGELWESLGDALGLSEAAPTLQAAAPPPQEHLQPRAFHLPSLAPLAIPHDGLQELWSVACSHKSRYLLLPCLVDVIIGFDYSANLLTVVQLARPCLHGESLHSVLPWHICLVAASEFCSAYGGKAFELAGARTRSSRDCMFFSAGLLVVASVASCSATTGGYLASARVASCIVKGVCSTAKAIYVCETSEAHLRAASLCLCHGLRGVGAALGALVGGTLLRTPGAWRPMLGAAAGVALALSAGARALPESPRWLLRRPRRHPRRGEARAEALAALVRLRDGPWEELQAELDALCQAPAGPPGGRAAEGVEGAKRIAALLGVCSAAAAVVAAANGLPHHLPGCHDHLDLALPTSSLAALALVSSCGYVLTLHTTDASI